MIKIRQENVSKEEFYEINLKVQIRRFTDILPYKNISGFHYIEIFWKNIWISKICQVHKITDPQEWIIIR